MKTILKKIAAVCLSMAVMVGVGLLVQVILLVGIHGEHYSKIIPGWLDLHTRL